MVIHDLNIMGVTATPTKTNTPLVVDANTMLPFAFAFKCLKSIIGRHLQGF